MTDEEKCRQLGLVKCECGYFNKIENVKRYGTCTRCKKVLDKESKIKYDLYNKLKIWRNEDKKGYLK